MFVSPSEKRRYKNDEFQMTDKKNTARYSEGENGTDGNAILCLSMSFGQLCVCA